MRADVANEAAVKAVVRVMAETFRTVDVLVNNARIGKRGNQFRDRREAVNS